MKKCPYCAEEIQNEAIKCKHCGEMLDKQTSTARQAAIEEIEEKTIREEKPKLKSYGAIFIIGFLLLPVFGIGLLLIIGAIIHRNSIRYTITNKRIKTQKGILERKTDEIDLLHIRDISLRQKLDEKIFGYGDILIGRVGRADYEIILKKINQPQETITLIKDLQNRR